MSEKLQKVLARAGLASRRRIETWIREERITVNGCIAKVGCRVSEKDKITVDGERIDFSKRVATPRIIAYHKPVGEVCTRADPEGRVTVFSQLPKLQQGRWIGVGRLDVNTSGLLLFTNDGELANRLMHPRAGLAREYAVRVFGKVTKEIVARLVQGVKLTDGFARFEDIVDSGGQGLNHWYHVVVMEGRHRLVRRLWESQGLQISRLKRVRFGPIFLEAKLKQGQWMELDRKVLQRFC